MAPQNYVQVVYFKKAIHYGNSRPITNNYWTVCDKPVAKWLEILLNKSVFQYTQSH